MIVRVGSCCNESLDLLSGEKFVGAFQYPFGHLYTTHRVVRNVFPIHGGSHDLAQEMPQMVSGLPCEAMRELVQEVLLYFHPRNVAQTMTTKLKNQVLAQQKRVNLPRSELECRQYSRLEAL